MDEERIQIFIEAMSGNVSDHIQELEQEALAAGVPIIRTQTRSLIQFLITLAKPKRILEVGCGIGYSASVMMECAGADTKLTTIELDHARAERARQVLGVCSTGFAPASDEEPGKVPESDMEHCEGSVYDSDHSKYAASDMEVSVSSSSESRIQVFEGDAAQILPTLQGTYDFIFMDAAKGQYIHFLPEILRLLAPGGVLVSDNIFQEGEILESRFAVKRRNRTIHARMREYIYTLTHTEALKTILLQEGDGAAVSVKR